MPRMPVKDAPEKLRPYLRHGLELDWNDNSSDAYGQCLWCNRETKFGVKLENGQGRCNVCSESCNVWTWLRKLHELSFEVTTMEDYEELQTNRGFLYPESLKEWQLAKSILNGNWLFPCYGTDLGEIKTLYQYIKSEKRTMWLPTDTLGHYLFGLAGYNPKAQTIFLCEGLWDAVSLWEVLCNTKESEGKLLPTSNRLVSMLQGANVLAQPSCGTFFETWCGLFSGKDVIIMCQNDHERKDDQGRIIPPASFNEAKRITTILSKHSPPPKSISYLPWGPNGYDTAYKHGYDIRDVLTQ